MSSILFLYFIMIIVKIFNYFMVYWEMIFLKIKNSGYLFKAND
jgi:hypothetical protein